ncbi:MAG: hypothetical protein Kow0022_08660 [Phycisphaerales bacterium]
METHTAVNPVVLVGGRSSRFGRDKLLEPMADGRPLVLRPIIALRSVFGPCVALVGRCDGRVADLGDRVIDDPYPGAGPAGGIVAALEACGSAVFVLSGDLPSITPEAVRTIADTAARSPDAWACLGHTDRLEPCIGIYRPAALEALRQTMRAGSSLFGAVPTSHLVRVPIDRACAVNVNRPDDLPGPRAGMRSPGRS